MLLLQKESTVVKQQKQNKSLLSDFQFVFYFSLFSAPIGFASASQSQSKQSDRCENKYIQMSLLVIHSTEKAAVKKSLKDRKRPFDFDASHNRAPRSQRTHTLSYSQSFTFIPPVLVQSLINVEYILEQALVLSTFGPVLLQFLFRLSSFG